MSSIDAGRVGHGRPWDVNGRMEIEIEMRHPTFMFRTASERGGLMMIREGHRHVRVIDTD